MTAQSHHTATNPRHLLQVRRRQRLHHTRPLTEPRLEDPIRILKHAVLQTNDNKLTSLEPLLDQPANILRMRQIQRRIYFIQNIHGRRLELQRHDQTQCDQGPLSARELSQALLPDLAQLDFDFEAIRDLFTLERIELSEGAGEEEIEDAAKVSIHFGPGLVQGFLLVFVEAGNCLLDLLLVADHGAHHVLKGDFLLLHAVNHVHDFGVDVALLTLEALRQGLEAGFAFGHVLAFEIVGGALLAEL